MVVLNLLFYSSFNENITQSHPHTHTHTYAHPNTHVRTYTLGTTKDNFLRENLEWLGKATNWAKFTAVASIGVVHKGHVRESMNLLQPYLPQGKKRLF